MSHGRTKLLMWNKARYIQNIPLIKGFQINSIFARGQKIARRKKSVGKKSRKNTNFPKKLNKLVTQCDPHCPNYHLRAWLLQADVREGEN